MTNAERIKLLTEQSDFLQLEVEKLRSLVQTSSISGELRLHPSGLRKTADILETIGKSIKGVADDMQKGA